MDINPHILPFSYVKTNRTFLSSSYMFSLLDTILQDHVKETVKLYPQTHPYPPVWGIKLSPSSMVLDVELYFYQYDPCTKACLYDWDGLEKLITMYSVDVSCKDVPNIYHVCYTNEYEDKGYSTKQNLVQNEYYRYNSREILRFSEFILPDYLTYYPNIKTTFIADKLYRHMIGVYYDGISSSQFSTFLSQYHLQLPPIPEDVYCSIHIDYDKDTRLPIRFGVYGILY